MHPLMKRSILPLCLMAICRSFTFAGETLPPLPAGHTPGNVEELYAGYDPAAEPLETEVLKEWEDDGVVLRVVRYRIGIFKGRKAMMAAIYGFPKGGKRLPGLVQVHGGGQFADFRAPWTNAKRGYATLSLAWAGRISAPVYQVDNRTVKLFWDGKTADPDYKLTTDWGALDAYHAPSRNAQNAFASVAPAAWTLDAVDSPRNNPWFLCVLGARRAVTFLAEQPEVDAQKLGVYGHSMGGKITVMTAATDARVKAAAPSCGGLSDRASDNALYRATLGDDAYLRRVVCPILFLSPANDFHGHIQDLQLALTEIKSPDWRVTCSPHGNHQDLPAYEVATLLWFDQQLKGSFRIPETPGTALDLTGSGGVPLLRVKPDNSTSIREIDVYYTQQGPNAGESEDLEHATNRFWHHAAAVRRGNAWVADLPLLTVARPLWVYANVLYPLAEPVTGAGYYYGTYTATQFNLSSKMSIVSPQQLQAAGVRASDQPALMIEEFGPYWRKEWFTYDQTDDWARKTHKLYDPKWTPPEAATLAMDVRSEQPNTLVVGLDHFAAAVRLIGGSSWQQVILTPADFHDASNNPLAGWKGIRELRLGDRETLRADDGGDGKQRVLGAKWQGAPPTFRKLRWQR